MRNILIIVVMILGCSAPQRAGGVSETGNCAIQITCITPDSVPVQGFTCTISPADFQATSTEIHGSNMISNNLGKTSLISIDSGDWAIFVEHDSLGMVLVPVSLSEGDSSKITIILTSGGTISCDSLARVTIPGAPKQFLAKNNSAVVPSGKFTVELTDQSGKKSYSAVVVLPNETTTISNSESQISIYDTTTLSTVYNVCFDGETVGFATGQGIRIDHNGMSKHFTTTNSPLLSNWVRDIRIHGDTIIAATDSGIAIWSDVFYRIFRGGESFPDDWVIQFADRVAETWFVTPSGIGYIENGIIAKSYPISEEPFMGSPTTAIACFDDGSIVTGGNRGIFRLFNGTWESDTSIRTLSITGSVTSITGTWENCIVSSNKSGLFQKKNGTWRQISSSNGAIPTDIVHAGDGVVGNRKFGGEKGWMFRETTEGFSKSQVSSADILSINQRDDGSIWIGTMYQGVIVLPQ